MRKVLLSMREVFLSLHDSREATVVYKRPHSVVAPLFRRRQ